MTGRRTPRALLGACAWLVLQALAASAAGARDSAPRHAAARDAAPSPPVTKPVRAAQRSVLNLAELGLANDVLRNATNDVQSVSFRARGDQVLIQGELELSLALPRALADFVAYRVELNGEPLARVPAAELGVAPRLFRYPLDGSTLASENNLGIAIERAAEPLGCGNVPAGSWQGFGGGQVALTGEVLPLPDDLSVLPLPFFDAEFDRAQVLHFVLPTRPSESQVRAALLVASWFALSGRGSLSFRVHLGKLPREHVIVLAAGPGALAELGLAAPVTAAGGRPALSLAAHPGSARHKLLLLHGADDAELERAARSLVREGYGLRGPTHEVQTDAPLPPLAADNVPRWVSFPGDVRLAQLPEKQALEVVGGRSDTLRLVFRATPDLFTWPREELSLELAYAQQIVEARGAARVHVALNGVSLGSLPPEARGSLRLPVPRDALRGYNELLLHVSYDAARGKLAAPCAAGGIDQAARVQLLPASRLSLRGARRFAKLPDLNLFLYDGYPFTAQGDLRETALLLPAEPLPAEFESAFELIARFASITGHVPSALAVHLGEASAGTLLGRDVLLVAARGHHSLLSRVPAAAPLVTGAGRFEVRYPSSAPRVLRYLSGRFDDGELARAERAVHDPQLGAAMAMRAPWDEARELVVVTADAAERMPKLPQLLGYARSEEPRNDLLIVTRGQRALFQLGGAHGRGQLPWLLGLRFWLAHYWLVMVPAVLLAALIFSTLARQALGELARRRLSGGSD